MIIQACERVCVITGFVYPPITHWIWTEEGWLNKLGYVDFSGCGPIHLTGGVCSFFGALFLGPRLGRFANKFNNSEKEEIEGHSVPVSVLTLSCECISYGHE
jgi:Amt family ammonium transporter